MVTFCGAFSSGVQRPSSRYARTVTEQAATAGVPWAVARRPDLAPGFTQSGRALALAVAVQ